jgi:RNA polymerase sigma factor (sigma-70 family)
MPSLTLPAVFRSFGTAASPPTPDQELLARFLEHHDESAFAALMERHGALVLGVCQRILRNRHDAEDACQAVFLVLARKASSIRKQASLASWLHGVAWNVAHKLRSRLAFRAVREEAAAAQKPVAAEPADITWREVQLLVDEEVDRLPKKYAAPLVLCYLEGRTQEEAAKELGWSLGALRGRLERGRERLRLRLTRRGVTGASAVAVAILLPGGASAALPANLVATTSGAAVMAGGVFPDGVPAHVAELARSALQPPLVAKTSFAALVSFALLMACFGLLWSTFEAAPAPAAPATFENWKEVGRLEIPGARIWTVAYSADGTRIAAGAGRFDAEGKVFGEGELRVWDVSTREILFTLKTKHSVRCVAFAPDGKTLATAEHDGRCRLRDASSGDVVFTLQGHKGQNDAVAFSADGATLATAGWDGAIKIWDTRTGGEIRALKGHRAQVFDVAFGADGTLASGGADATVRIWPGATDKSALTLAGHRSVVHWVAFAPDGNVLATASWDMTVKLWAPSTGKLLSTLEGHTEGVLHVAFSPDGKTLASSAGGRLGRDMPGEIILWDLAAQKTRARFVPADRAYGVAFSPDGGTLAAACWDGAVALWKVDADQPTRAADAEGDRAIKFVRADDPPPGGEKVQPKANYKEDYKPSFAGNGQDVTGLSIYGLDAVECVKYEANGLRITLPPGCPKQRPGTGVVTDFGVKGDFEISAAFEILNEPNAGLGGNVTDLKLVLAPLEPPTPGVWRRSNQNRAVLARQAAGRGLSGAFDADVTKWDPEIPHDQWGNPIFAKVETHQNRRQLALAKSGRLRAVRNGSLLSFAVSDGAGKDFTILHTAEFGGKDLKNVRLLGSTGGPGANFDIRVTDLRIRADAFFKTAESLTPAPAAAGSSKRNWLPTLTWAAAPVAIIVLSLGIWAFYLRRPRAAPIAAPALIGFPCGNCGKALRAKAELAGRKVKCPHCRQAALVPRTAEKSL